MNIDINTDIDIDINKNNYIKQNMITCIGNKRKLINYIEDIIKDIIHIENKNTFKIMDAFCGSTIVSRMLSYYSSELITNDIEKYSYIMSKCFLQNPNKEDMIKINQIIDKINTKLDTDNLIEGIITLHYSPKDTNNIKQNERCFYTRDNAMRIDTIRYYIDKEDPKYYNYLLSALLIKASIHTNTGGIFKGFYKNKNTGIGQWGGTSENSLSRIKGSIYLDKIIWNNLNYKFNAYNQDINKLLKSNIINDHQLDIIYLDPPYNQHSYGSNYFMLNTIIKNNINTNISKVSGIPTDWNRSKYNSITYIKDTIMELINLSLLKAKYVILSYNEDGFIKPSEWKQLLTNYKYKKYDILYDTYKGSRNLYKKNNKVIEIIYLFYK